MQIKELHVVWKNLICHVYSVGIMFLCMQFHLGYEYIKQGVLCDMPEPLLHLTLLEMSECIYLLGHLIC